MYRYEMIAKSDENPTERQFLELTAEVTAIKLQTDDVPQRYFIDETPSGHIRFDRRIDGYCAVTGRYICIQRGLGPKLTVATTIHEMRHAFQCQDPKRHRLSAKMRERDADLFEIEFWGSHRNSGDAVTLERTLNEILQEDLDRVWKKACASARARLSRPAETESSAALRQQFAPVIRARSLAVQRTIDPTNSRQPFPPGIEFSSPSPCAGLTVSCQK